MIRLFKRLFSRSQKEDRIGYAVLRKDEITGKKYWETWDGEGENKIIFELEEPLILPPGGLPIGTMIVIYRKK